MRGVRRFFPRLPAPLIAVVLAVVLVQALALDRAGVAVLGAVPAGLPSLGWNPVPPALLLPLVTGAAGLALVSFTSGMVTARSFAARNHYEIDVDREFIALGACNVAASLSQGFAVTGADSRTAVADVMGGKTQVTGLVAAATIALVLLFFTGPLQYLPNSALGAVLISAGLGLFDWRALVRFYRIQEGEFLVCMAAMLGVVTLGALRGHWAVDRAGDAGAADSLVPSGGCRSGTRRGPAGLPRPRTSRGRGGHSRSRALPLHGVADFLQRAVLQAPGARRW